MTEKLSQHYKSIIRELGENPEREGLLKTPDRAANAMEYLTEGYHKNLNDIVNEATFESAMSELVVVKEIEFYSLCEHHMLPFFGKAHIGYLPNGRVLGLSKIPRIVDMFARRLQIQEKLTHEVAKAIETVTGAKGVAVVMEAQHCCMMMRGVEKQSASMTTSVMLGLCRSDPRTRSEFLSLIR